MWSRKVVKAGRLCGAGGLGGRESTLGGDIRCAISIVVRGAESARFHRAFNRISRQIIKTARGHQAGPLAPGHMIICHIRDRPPPPRCDLGCDPSPCYLSHLLVLVFVRLSVIVRRIDTYTRTSVFKIISDISVNLFPRSRFFISITLFHWGSLEISDSNPGGLWWGG